MPIFRITESSALLVDEVFPHQPVRQWVLSFPFQLRFLFASRPLITGRVLGIVSFIRLTMKLNYLLVNPIFCSLITDS